MFPIKIGRKDWTRQVNQAFANIPQVQLAEKLPFPAVFWVNYCNWMDSSGCYVICLHVFYVCNSANQLFIVFLRGDENI